MLLLTAAALVRMFLLDDVLLKRMIPSLDPIAATVIEAIMHVLFVIGLATAIYRTSRRAQADQLGAVLEASSSCVSRTLLHEDGRLEYLYFLASATFPVHRALPLCFGSLEACVEVYHPEDRARTLRTWRKAARDLEPFSLVCRLRSADGAHRWVQHSGTPKRRADGAIEFFNVVLDVHDAECARRDHEEQIGQILAAIPITINRAIEATDGSITIDLFRTSDRYPLKRALGERFESFDVLCESYHPDDVAAYRAARSSAAERLQPFSHTLRVRTAGNEYRWIRAFSSPQSQADGSIAWMTVSIDIQREESNRLEREALNEQQASILEALPIMVHRSVDHGDGTVTRVYRRCSRDFPLRDIPSQQRHAKDSILDVMHPDDRAHVNEVWGRATESMTPYDLTARILGDDGRHHWARYTSRPTRLENGDVQWDGVGIDVSDEQRLRSDLDAEREVLERLTDSTTDHVVIFDREGRITFASRQMLADFGLSREDVLGARIDSIIADRKDLHRAMRTIDGAIGSGETARFERASDLGFGRRIWSGVVTPLRDSDGAVEGALLVARDMTDRTDAIAARLRAEQRLRAFFDASNVGIIVADADLNMTEVNPAMARMIGRSVDEVKRLGWMGIFDRSDELRCLAEFERHLVGGVDTYHELKRALHTDGQVRWLSETVSIVRDADGGLDFVILVLQDRTLEFAAQEHLRESEARYRALFENAAAWTAVVSLDDVVVEANQACADAFGRPLEDMPGLDVLPAVHPDDAPRAKDMMASLRSGRAQRVSGEVRFVTPGGRTLHTVVSLGAFTHEQTGERLISAAVADITQRTQALERERRTEARFRAAIETSRDGFKIAEPVRNARGEVTDFRYLEANSAGCTMLGSAPDAVIGRTMCELWPFAKSTHIFDRYVRVLETGEPASFELECGDHLPVEWLHVELRRLDGNLIINYRDISERKKSIEQLESLAMRLDTATRSAGVGIWEFEPASGALSWTPTMFEIFGVRPEHFGGRFEDWAGSVHPDDLERTTEELNAAIVNGHEFSTQFRIVRRNDGEVRDVIVLAKIERDTGGSTRRVVGVNIDVTEREQGKRDLEQLLARQRLLLDELDHRTRNMLAGLSSLVELTAENARDVPTYAETLRTRIESMARSHRVLSDSHWEPVELRQLLELIPDSSCAGGMHAEGPDVLIPTRQVTPFAVVLHELASNLMKHGASNAQRGRLSISWELTDQGVGEQPVLMFRWVESQLDEDPRFDRDGLGLGLIGGFARSELRGSHSLRTVPRGLEHRFEFRLDPVPHAPHAHRDAQVETRPGRVASPSE
ncbi:MAG: PAS domain S-box protein [Planctomycetota bacterium]